MQRYTIRNCYLLASFSMLLLSGCESNFLEEKPTPSITETELLRRSGNALIKSGNFSEAVKVFDQLIALDHKNSLAYNGKAVAFDYSGNHLAAQDIYKTALSLSPDSVPIKNNLAMSLILNHQQEQAIKLLEPLLSNNTNNKSSNNIIRHNLALAYGISGQHKKATKLNLHDMTKEQAQENIRFYKNYITNSGDKKRYNKNINNIGFITPSPPPAITINKSTDTKKNVNIKESKDTSDNANNSSNSNSFMEEPIIYKYPN